MIFVRSRILSAKSALGVTLLCANAQHNNALWEPIKDRFHQQDESLGSSRPVYRQRTFISSWKLVRCWRFSGDCHLNHPGCRLGRLEAAFAFPVYSEIKYKICSRGRTFYFVIGYFHRIKILREALRINFTCIINSHLSWTINIFHSNWIRCYNISSY